MSQDDHNQNPHSHSDDDGGMAMSAIFTGGTHIVLFFPGWETSSLASYLIALLLLFALAWFNRFLAALRSQLDVKSRLASRVPGVPLMEPPPRGRKSNLRFKERMSPLPLYTELNKDGDDSGTQSLSPASLSRPDGEGDGLIAGPNPSGRSWSLLSLCGLGKVSQPWSWRRKALRALLEGVRALLGYLL